MVESRKVRFVQTKDDFDPRTHCGLCGYDGKSMEKEIERLSNRLKAIRQYVEELSDNPFRLGPAALAILESKCED